MSDDMDWLRGYISLNGNVLTERVSRSTGMFVNLAHHGPDAGGWIVKTWSRRCYQLKVNKRGQVVNSYMSIHNRNPGRYRSWEHAYRDMCEFAIIVCQCKGVITDEWAKVLKARILYDDHEDHVLAARDLEVAAEQQEERYQAKKAEQHQQRYGHALYNNLKLGHINELDRI
jgi:hypothetical protein